MKHPKIMLLCLILILLSGAAVCIAPGRLPEERSVPTAAPETAPTEPGDWALTLVNADHPIPADWESELVTLSNGVQVDARIYPDLQAMFDEARSEGIYPVVGEGYRTHEAQEAMLQEKISAFLAEGYSQTEAEQLARDWVAEPGTSEHELGLAADINADKTRSANEEVYTWLAENAADFGFILRYPADKTDITGIDYEPWHYRYVGKEAAAEIMQSHLTLEEYLAAQ